MFAADNLSDLHAPIQITIGACTFRRPENLRALLESLHRLQLSPSVDLNILIVDNDTTPSAKHLVEAAQEYLHWKIRYIHESTPGICSARNRVIFEAGNEGFLAFVDDDETVDPLWISRLLEAQQKTNATFVQGPVVMSVDENGDEWWLKTTFFKQNFFEDLTELRESWTNNVLIDLSFVHEHGLRFDETLSFEGGEDTLFFQDVVAHGGNGYFAQNALVYEVQTPERLNWKWGLKRQYRYGITRAKTATMRRSKTSAAAYCFVRGNAMIFMGIVNLASIPIKGRLAVANASALMARGAGVFAGFFGLNQLGYQR